MDFWVIFHGLRPTEVYCIILYFLLFTHFPNPNVAHIFVSQLELHLSWRVVIGMWGKAREGDHHTVHTVHSTTQAHRHTWLHLSTASSSASSFLSSPLPSLLSFHCHHYHFLCFSPPSSSATSSTSPPLKKWEFLWTANSCTWDPVLHLSCFLSVAMMMMMMMICKPLPYAFYGESTKGREDKKNESALSKEHGSAHFAWKWMFLHFISDFSPDIKDFTFHIFHFTSKLSHFAYLVIQPAFWNVMILFSTRFLSYRYVSAVNLNISLHWLISCFELSFCIFKMIWENILSENVANNVINVKMTCQR